MSLHILTLPLRKCPLNKYFFNRLTLGRAYNFQGGTCSYNGGGGVDTPTAKKSVFFFLCPLSGQMREGGWSLKYMSPKK